MGWNEFTLDFIDPFGKIFINVLKLIAVPLVLFSIISGVSALGDVTKLGKIGIKTLLLYVGTTVIAVTIGLIAVNTLKPGDKVSEDLLIDNRIAYELWTNANDIERLDGICYSCDEAYADRVAVVSHTAKRRWCQRLGERQADQSRSDQAIAPASAGG